MPRSLNLRGPHTENWLKMPTREIGSLDTPNGDYGVGTTILKKHKTLPHRREERIADVRPSTPVDETSEINTDTLFNSAESTPQSLKHASKRVGVPDLPPTPPTHSRQSSGTHPTIPTSPLFDVSLVSAQDVRSGPTTPLNNRSPPTPEFTPPKVRPLPERAPASERYASSRAESFKTARENLDSSDDEAVTLRGKLSARPSTEAQMRKTPPRRKAVGLGLGLESDRGSSPKYASVSQEEFIHFDGEWGRDFEEVEREWDDNLMRNVTVRKRRPTELHKTLDGTTDEVVEDNLITTPRATKVVRSLPLQERIARHRLERDAANRVVSEPIRKPATPESPTFPEAKRFSGMSSRSVSSTIVEAIVVDTPPQRQRTLRHTKKQFGLRSISSDQSTLSGTGSTSSNRPPHRLVHKDKQIPGRRHRRTNSNTTVRTASSDGRSRKAVLRDGGVPVVIIPERRSSSKSREPSLRSTSSKRTGRSLSVGSAPLSNSAKYNDPKLSPHRRRTHSESGGSGNSIRTIDFPPEIPTRRSSLSAPTSRNTSRAGSLTAESLKAHNKLQEKRVSKLLDSPIFQARVESPKDSSNMRLNVDQNGDPFFGKRPSQQVTPFSQTSYDTAGTNAEVSEALAISFFPHQNKSVLMVEHDGSPPRTSESMTGPKIQVNGRGQRPLTPPQLLQPMEVDSPLHNPRQPPEPPAIKFIPPTPNSELSPADTHPQYDFEDALATSEVRPKRGLSLLRHAFSNRRRHSESVVVPSTHSPRRSFSLSGRTRDQSTQTSKADAHPATLYPSVLDQPADESKLHPFWRPSSFWDDLEDQGYDEDEDYEGGIRWRGSYPIINNRPAPQRTFSGRLRKTFAILPSNPGPENEHNRFGSAIDRRTVRKSSSGNLRVVKQRSNSSLRKEGQRAMSDGRIGYGVKEVKGTGSGRSHVISGLGIRVEYVGWGGVREKLRERQRERRREGLRKVIGGPVGVEGGVDSVLRGQT